MRQQNIMRAINITFAVCISVFVAVVVYNLAIYFKVEHWCNKLDVRAYIASTKFECDTSTNYSLADIRTLIESDFDLGLYFYKETNINWASGITNFTIRLVKIDKTSLLSKEYYAYALAHEFTHLKYYNGNEAWTNYMAWKYLYESDNHFLHNVGLWLANDITQGKYANSYDCGWWILEYLGENNG